MRILYLTEEAIGFSGTMVRGGAIHVRNVVSALRERGHDVSLVDWNPAPERLFQHSVTPRFGPLEGPARTLARAVAVGRRRGVDVVVSKTRKTYLPGLLAARTLGVPHVVHVGSTLGSVERSVRDRLNATSVETRLRAPHDGYLVVCRYIVDQLRERGVPAGRLFDVRNAVDVERFTPEGPTLPVEYAERLPDEGFRVGFVGGLHRYKGVYDLLTSVERADHDVRAVVAGDGPARERVERIADDATTLLGAVPYEHVPALYRAVDAFVLPSHTEGLPRVILEAQATETPVVATRVGGVPEVVEDGETGLLCPPRSPTDLAAAIDRLAASEEVRQRLGTNGRRAVESGFTWEELYDRYERALGRVVSR
ncbi:glycosyltransferase family 4 protein [Halomarina oriensis]|uniref:Glycosyltransferase n=1 Tax=Halomarina oriensis TaxID=671145 RepID=A0A6B0GLB1_9EURY|nr:glycosyltransferase family 4 protein [Halomarina oriensis]MWG32895.1 glycosyltransferase [Halomarina oriensis]